VPAEQWFTENVHAHESHLRSYLRSSFPRMGDVDDVVQESYLRVWKAKAAQPILSARAFLFKVARHLALDLVRRKQRSPVQAVGDLDGLFVLEEEPDVAERCSFQEKIDLLAEAIALLPDRRREVVILCKLRRLPQKDVSARLGISERTVENQLFRGIKQCRRFLAARGVTTLFADEE
jgi:RNA polymerase sigma-70 factor (ECF subfamily)